jgi:hypothetical protein
MQFEISERHVATSTFTIIIFFLLRSFLYNNGVIEKNVMNKWEYRETTLMNVGNRILKKCFFGKLKNENWKGFW